MRRLPCPQTLHAANTGAAEPYEIDMALARDGAFVAVAFPFVTTVSQDGQEVQGPGLMAAVSTNAGRTFTCVDLEPFSLESANPWAVALGFHRARVAFDGNAHLHAAWQCAQMVMYRAVVPEPALTVVPPVTSWAYLHPFEAYLPPAAQVLVGGAVENLALAAAAEQCAITYGRLPGTPWNTNPIAIESAAGGHKVSAFHRSVDSFGVPLRLGGEEYPASPGLSYFSLVPMKSQPDKPRFATVGVEKRLNLTSPEIVAWVVQVRQAPSATGLPPVPTVKHRVAFRKLAPGEWALPQIHVDQGSSDTLTVLWEQGTSGSTAIRILVSRSMDGGATSE